ncbi:MAG: hypothetical protein ACYCV7_13960 [Acidimicrobiales bacterium]
MLVVVGAQSESDHEHRRLVAGLDRWRTKARSLAADKKRLVAELAASKARVVELEGQLIAATEKIATLSKLCFGTSSEKKGEEEERARGCSGERVRGAGRSESAPRRRAPSSGPAARQHRA